MTAFFTALLQNLKRRPPRLKSQEVPLQLEPALLRLANLAPPHFPKRFPDSGTGKKSENPSTDTSAVGLSSRFLNQLVSHLLHFERSEVLAANEANLL